MQRFTLHRVFRRWMHPARLDTPLCVKFDVLRLVVTRYLWRQHTATDVILHSLFVYEPTGRGSMCSVARCREVFGAWGSLAV
jgi:hypothetical protein